MYTFVQLSELECCLKNSVLKEVANKKMALKYITRKLL